MRAWGLSISLISSGVQNFSISHGKPTRSHPLLLLGCLLPVLGDLLPVYYRFVFKPVVTIKAIRGRDLRRFFCA
jgi:hypothetical protein